MAAPAFVRASPRSAAAVAAAPAPAAPAPTLTPAPAAPAPAAAPGAGAAAAAAATATAVVVAAAAVAVVVVAAAAAAAAGAAGVALYAVCARPYFAFVCPSFARLFCRYPVTLVWPPFGLRSRSFALVCARSFVWPSFGFVRARSCSYGLWWGSLRALQPSISNRNLVHTW